MQVVFRAASWLAIGIVNSNSYTKVYEQFERFQKFARNHLSNIWWSSVAPPCQPHQCPGLLPFRPTTLGWHCSEMGD